MNAAAAASRGVLEGAGVLSRPGAVSLAGQTHLLGARAARRRGERVPPREGLQFCICGTV
eukprot:CAMPEP_0171500720 /NCGR_PEP_ID=MMETSP0958-20121227/9142_1 /TAXON_ID=87120 /ORGANISM="Aurantiochytrium limacinum, Strain ATCCMYA-1381" /LENGTH=59 /DNA_ID=CAMNT_0012035421 /DNA_START=854 /DNA_END=1029 /DNA_ORIENTATION=+